MLPFFLAMFPNTSMAQYSYSVKQKIYIRPNLLGQCLARVTREGYSNFSYSKSHMNYRFDKDQFFNYLSGFPGHTPYKTGKEEQLKEWVLKQQDNSVDPVNIFKESMRLNDGNIWNATLTIHELIRNNARWRYKQFYNYNSSDEQERAFFNKFIDIRGDLKELGSFYNGDHAGTWYRIWGIMLYRLSKTDESLFEETRRLSGGSLALMRVDDCKVSFPFIRHVSQNLQTAFVAYAAEWVKITMPQEYWGEDLRKAEINDNGGQIMSQLIMSLLQDQRTFQSKVIQQSECDRRTYLK